MNSDTHEQAQRLAAPIIARYYDKDTAHFAINDFIDAIEQAGLQIVPAARPACATAARDDDLTRRIGEAQPGLGTMHGFASGGE